MTVGRTPAGRFRWLPRVSRATAENSVVSQVDRPGSTMVVPVGQMGILSAHAWCCISVKNTMGDTNDLCKSCNSMIVSLHILCYKLLIIKHVL